MKLLVDSSCSGKVMQSFHIHTYLEEGFVMFSRAHHTSLPKNRFTLTWGVPSLRFSSFPYTKAQNPPINAASKSSGSAKHSGPSRTEQQVTSDLSLQVADAAS